MDKRKALGRGLSALIPSSNSAATALAPVDADPTGAGGDADVAVHRMPESGGGSR